MSSVYSLAIQLQSAKENDLEVLYMLGRNPGAGAASTLEPYVRRFVVSWHNSIFYQVNNNTVQIITVMDNRQDPNLIEEEVRNAFL